MKIKPPGDGADREQKQFFHQRSDCQDLRGTLLGLFRAVSGQILPAFRFSTIR